MPEQMPNDVPNRVQLSIAVRTCSHHTAMTDTSFHVTLDGNVIFCEPHTIDSGVLPVQRMAGNALLQWEIAHVRNQAQILLIFHM